MGSLLWNVDREIVEIKGGGMIKGEKREKVGRIVEMRGGGRRKNRGKERR